MDEKRSVVTEKLSQRESERQSEIQRRYEEKDQSKSIQENVKEFTESFSDEKSKIEREIGECSQGNKVEITTKLDSITNQLGKLQKYLAESTIFLPKYEVRQAHEVISNLQQQIQDKRDDLIPKKKFAFKSKKKNTENSAIDSEPTRNGASVKTCLKDDDLQVDLADCKFVDCHNSVLVKEGKEIFQKDISLARLRDCTIKLFGAPSTVHMKKLNNCKVFCGPVSSSIFVSDCEDCLFVISCQQLRTHSTLNSKFYLHVTSRAIIEDCSEIYFAPYNLCYDNLDRHFKESGLDKLRNNWNDVDDFNWLASDEHSPNWFILPEEERVSQFTF